LAHFGNFFALCAFVTFHLQKKSGTGSIKCQIFIGFCRYSLRGVPQFFPDVPLMFRNAPLGWRNGARKKPLPQKFFPQRREFGTHGFHFNGKK
jgi:hypothetical protein